MKVLIIGLGSIAQKHINALRIINPDVEIFALRRDKASKNLPGITNIYKISEAPTDLDFIIISNPTSKHLLSITEVLALRVPLFIEKPPFDKIDGAYDILKEVNKQGIITYTAFNLRFHPVLQWLRQNLNGKRVLEVQAYCGSYLPDWRPDTDYRKVYSSNKELGGGVHLDLIHELDYMTWLFGKASSVSGFTSKISDLEIDVPDSAHYWLKYESMVASITLNYFRRDTKRTLEIVFEDATWSIDLVKYMVSDSEGNVLFKTPIEGLVTYEYQMRYFIDCLKSDSIPMNSLSESIVTLELCLNTSN